MIKYLVTGGCSFSQPCNADITWPMHLEEYLVPVHTLHGGRGCADNTTIARLVIYNMHQMLERGAKPGEILVGIMWSGVDRHSVYNTRNDFPHDPFCDITGNRDPETGLPYNYHFNPVFVACEEYNQYLIHANFEDQSSKNYWENFYDPVGSQIQSLENVLRVQWFLKSLGVRYFMTEYSWYSIHDHRSSYDTSPQETLCHPDVAYLLEMVDKSCWLSVSNMTDWTEANQIPYSRPNDNHPSTQAHQQFVDQIIVPHLDSRNLLNCI